MKKIIWMGAAIVVLAAACKKDLLDKGYLDRFPEEAIWKDKSLAEGYVFDTYGRVLQLYYNQKLDDWTDNNCNNYTNNVSLDNIDNNYDAGWNQYARIRNCNLVLEKLTNNTAILEADRKVMIAEGKFLRALVYYFMAQRFGGVMIVDKVLEANTADFRLPRKSMPETYDFILKDLAEAATDLPATAATGRASKGAALAMRTRVALQGAAYIPAKKDAYLDIVIADAQAVLGMNYALDADYAGMFNDFGKAQASKELILAYFRKGINTSFSSTAMQALCPNHGNEKLNPGYNHPPFTESFEGWPERFPSQNLVDAYEVVDEADGKAKKWNATSYYTDFLANGGYVSKAIYRNRDKRFYATVVYDSTKLFNNAVLTRALGNMNRLSNVGGEWGVSESNYYYRKGLYEVKKLWYSDPTDHHQSVIRLGEVYLNYAEALLLKSRTAEAVAAINKTRETHGGLPALGTLTQAEAWTAYRNERRVDMVLEEDRYWSLLRWAKFNGQATIPELAEPIRGIDIAADGRSFTIAAITLNNNSNRQFNARRFLFPVPQGQIQANPNLAPNNDGW
ncbi:RagB/SusD family nutrient uptake outer membrane protein [Chitinophaga lutea]|uniref:RagB/SusD family nutrient uptake outer membrane protein n=1 Tax=Chitinophaga lutea TaxID=2488634 RepID=A0A3N4PJK4_9BACT|nr:RagB/SusD family nutrient uptake outer membrane protein [Chitinophaga lutea]RPE08863.1 RagB/SusD family nutrient uptake outer membrane protein [Chitinophaga lutea]